MSNQKTKAVCGYMTRTKSGEEIRMDDHVVGFALHSNDKSDPWTNLKLICSRGTVINSDGTFMNVTDIKCGANQIKKLELSKNGNTTTGKYICVNSSNTSSSNTFDICSKPDSSINIYSNGIQFCGASKTILFSGSELSQSNENIIKCQNPAKSSKQFRIAGLEFDARYRNISPYCIKF